MHPAPCTLSYLLKSDPQAVPQRGTHAAARLAARLLRRAARALQHAGAAGGELHLPLVAAGPCCDEAVKQDLLAGQAGDLRRC